MPIASITKLMTAMVVLDAKMDLEESITIASEDVDTIRHSRSRLPVNTRLTRENALLLALMASENRAAHALGRTYPGGLGAFAAAMNAKAQVTGTRRDTLHRSRRYSLRQRLLCQRLGADGGRSLPI